jgi:hypothetical protein
MGRRSTGLTRVEQPQREESPLDSRRLTVTPEGIRVAVFYTKLHDDCSGHSSTLTSLRQQLTSVGPLGLLSTYSVTTSSTPVSGLLPETCHKIQRPGHQEDLRRSRDSLRSLGIGGPSGQLGHR